MQRQRAATHALDYLRDSTAERLVDRVFDVVDGRFERVLDLQSGGAAEMDRQVQRIPGLRSLTKMDWSQAELARSSGGPVEPDRRVWTHESRLDGVEDDSHDLIVSNLGLHWVNDLPGLLAECRRVLRPDGLLLGCMIGGRSLTELRRAFVLADLERNGGISPHVSPMAGVSDLGNLLGSAGFALPTVDYETLTVHSRSALRLMAEFRAMGESNAVAKRPQHPILETLLATSILFQHLTTQPTSRPNDADLYYPCTFDIIYFTAWKPHTGQQKPLDPGSATHSLKDIASHSGSFDVS